VDWLLRHGKQGPQPRKLDWGQTAALERIDRELAGQPPGQRRWYVTREGHTMTVVPAPVEFLIGSPHYEIGRLEKNEDQVVKRIPRSFAIASKGVTVAQFRRFLDANPKVKEQHSYTTKYSPEDGGPIISVTWFEAAQYCNWLSAQEGIPEDQWCYPPIDEIKEGMVMPKDYLQRTGYRLPTEAEWEFACRAGAATTFSFGGTEPLLREYAWYRQNGQDRTWPVGQLKPNDLGMFDVHGNVWSWCQCRYLEYKAGDDVEDADVKVTGLQSRSLRGAAFNLGAAFARCADRNGNRPSNRSDGVGFAPARTIRRAEK
jgi:formylglycine-generating enzyme required for sulfatase activity